jgi:hypothetical protein
MLVNTFNHHGQRGDVTIIPQAAFDVGSKIAAVVDLDFFGANHTPTAFSFDAPHGGQRPRQSEAHAIAVRYLKKTVWGSDRANLNRLKKDIESVLELSCFVAIQCGKFLTFVNFK